MGLFRPIWESKDPNKIRKYIDSTQDTNWRDQEKLSAIALHCSFADLRITAAQKIRDTAVRVSTMMAARKNGDMETVQAIIDKRNPGSSICESDLFFYVVESKDMELLSLLAMRVKTYSEWNLRKKELEPLLELPGFDEVRSHYAVLKQADDEAKREAAKEKRKETEMKNHKEFLQNPREKLEKAAGKTKENKLWKEWYEYQYNTEPQRIIGMVLHDLKDLDWAGHFPAEYLADTVVKSSGNYVGENDYSKKSAGKDIRLLLKTLYEKREDMREAILALNGILYYEGREAFKVNFGDSHEDWFVDFDPLPAYKLSVYMSGSELQVQLDETKAGSVQA